MDPYLERRVNSKHNKIFKKLINIRKIELKVSSVKFLPFKRLKVKIKKEIVSLGKGKIDVYKHRGKLINPNEWDNIEDKNIRLIDVRNEYEIKIGSFERSENPTKNFREFPAAVKNKINKNNKLQYIVLAEYDVKKPRLI